MITCINIITDLIRKSLSRGKLSRSQCWIQGFFLILKAQILLWATNTIDCFS